MKRYAPQSNLALRDETFALVGQQLRAERCARCDGSDALIVSGYCETCQNQRNQEQIIAEAQQRTFFGD